MIVNGLVLYISSNYRFSCFNWWQILQAYWIQTKWDVFCLWEVRHRLFTNVEFCFSPHLHLFSPHLHCIYLCFFQPVWRIWIQSHKWLSSLWKEMDISKETFILKHGCTVWRCPVLSISYKGSLWWSASWLNYLLCLLGGVKLVVALCRHYQQTQIKLSPPFYR